MTCPNFHRKWRLNHATYAVFILYVLELYRLRLSDKPGSHCRDFISQWIRCTEDIWKRRRKNNIIKLFLQCLGIAHAIFNSFQPLPHSGQIQQRQLYFFFLFPPPPPPPPPPHAPLRKIGLVI